MTKLRNPSQYSSLLSNAKWRKFFLVMGGQEFSFKHCYFKFIDTQEPRILDLSRPKQLYPEGYIDTIEFGPVRLSEVEWIEIPCSFKALQYNGDAGIEKSQDIDGFSKSLGEAGNWHIVRTESAIRIIAQQRLNVPQS